MNFSHCTAFRNGTRKESVKLQQGEALLHGRSVPVWEQRSFTTATPICGAPAVWGFRRAAVAFASDRRRRGFHPRPDDPFEKGSIENFYILDKNFKLRRSRSLTIHYSLFTLSLFTISTPAGGATAQITKTFITLYLIGGSL